MQKFNAYDSYTQKYFLSREMTTNQEVKSTQDCISAILSRSIPERCNQLTHYLLQASHKELHHLFSYIVEDIFGFGPNHTPGWGLVEIAKTRNTSSFVALLKFLSPTGPLISTAYRLLADGRVQYEFPISRLPINTQRLLEEGNVPPLYNQKIPYAGTGRIGLPSHILLNPFEYYFFHFSYFIVNPTYSKGASFPSSMLDSLYPCLLEEYFKYFLSLDNTTNIPLIPFSNQTVYHASNVELSSNPAFEHLKGSFSPSIYSTENRSYVDLPLRNYPNEGFNGPNIVQDEIWRSQTLILTFVEFWLNLASNDSNLIFNPIIQESFVPSSCQMHLVRLFVKYLHRFSCSAIKSDEEIISNLSFEANNPWNEFKRNVFSHCVQKKLYTFLKLSFARWPLDSTFRLPLETWLSCIQPWRYERTFGEQTISTRTEGELIDSKWEHFIAENLLFYSVLFQNVLQSFFRLELTWCRQSYLLYRVCKVFSLPNLRQMILEVENQLQQSDLSQLNNSLLFQTNISNSTNIHSHVFQKIFELEGVGYEYEPMFGAKVRAKVLKLLNLIKEARQTVLIKAAELSQIKKGWWTTFVEIFSSNEYNLHQFTPSELRIAEEHLNVSANQLCTMFKLSMPSPEENIVPKTSNNSFLDYEPNMNVSKYVSKIPKEKISYQNIKYQGNPDLQPIRTFEVAFLVRLFYHLSTLINEKYKDDIAILYSRPDYFGRFVRQFLSPPIVCKKGEHDDSLCALPPRVSLRILAHKQLLAYLIVFYAIAWLFGYGTVEFVVFLLILLLIFAFFGTIFCKDNLP